MKKNKRVAFFLGTIALLAATKADAASSTIFKEDKVIPKNLIAQQAPQILLPRAIPASVGEVSASSLDASTPQFALDSNLRVNLVLSNASAKTALQSLAKSARLNIAFYEDSESAKQGEGKVSIDLQDEPIQSAFNYILRLGNLEASKVGNTIFIGSKLPDSLRETVAKTLRLNQASAVDASIYLATQGAEGAAAKPSGGTKSGGGTESSSGGGGESVAAKPSGGGSSGSKLLKGLSVSVDDRLNTIMLVGSPYKVRLAETMLTKLDARRKQVALNVKIVDVNLSNTDAMSNSLSFKAGEGFLSVDKGAAVFNYGGYNPATNSQTLNSPTTPPIGSLTLPGGNSTFLDYNPGANLSGQGGQNANSFGNNARPNLGTTANPYQPGVSAYDPPGAATVTAASYNTGTATFNTTTTPAISPQTGQLVAPGGQLSDGSVINPLTGQRVAPGGLLTPSVTTAGAPGKITYALPTNYQLPSKFLSTLQAQIISGNGKILTDPTLVVQEGQKSTVNLTQDVFGGFETTSVAGTGAVTSNRKPIINKAGLTLDIMVNRIDDNGYVSVAVSPTVSSIGNTITTADGEISLLQSRTMNSGEIRLRDGQTLILSGIIQQSDRTSVSKVPILGDIPILGALFRSTNKTNQRQEVVVLLTPQVLSDTQGQVNYTPGVDARLMIGK